MEVVAKQLRALTLEDPKDHLPLYYLGILDQLRTDDRRAVESLTRVVKIVPTFAEACPAHSAARGRPR